MKNATFALLLLAILAIAACGCLGAPAGTTSQHTAARDTVFIGESGQVASGDRVYLEASKDAYAPVATAAPTPAPGIASSGQNGIDTKIIMTAYLTLEVKDVPGAIEGLRGIASAKGGYVTSTNVQKDGSNRISGTVVMRVPQAQFDSALTGAKALGSVKSASTRGEDVTEEYVDLKAQESSYTNQLAQYNAIMKQSTKVEDIIKVQEQIDRVQTALDRLEGRLRYLNNRVDYSTITVNLVEPEPVGGDTGHSFISTFNEGIAGFIGMIDALIIIVLTLLPIIIIGGAGYGIYRWRKAKTPAKDTKGTAEIKEK